MNCVLFQMITFPEPTCPMTASSSPLKVRKYIINVMGLLHKHTGTLSLYIYETLKMIKYL